MFVGKVSVESSKKRKYVFFLNFFSISILDSSPKLSDGTDVGPKLTGIPDAEGGGDDTLMYGKKPPNVCTLDTQIGKV